MGGALRLLRHFRLRIIIIIVVGISYHCHYHCCYFIIVDAMTISIDIILFQYYRVCHPIVCVVAARASTSTSISNYNKHSSEKRVQSLSLRNMRPFCLYIVHIIKNKQLSPPLLLLIILGKVVVFFSSWFSQNYAYGSSSTGHLTPTK